MAVGSVTRTFLMFGCHIDAELAGVPIKTAVGFGPKITGGSGNRRSLLHGPSIIMVDGVMSQTLGGFGSLVIPGLRLG